MMTQHLTLKRTGQLAPPVVGLGEQPLVQQRGDLIDYYEHIVLPPRRTVTDTDPGHASQTVTVAHRDSSSVPENEDGSLRAAPRITGLALLLAALQLVVGYEWLVSGVDKLLDGTFPDQLGALIASAATGGRLPDFFALFLQQVVLPNSYVFGWTVEVGETLTGTGILAGTFFALFGPTLRERLAATGARRALDVIGALTFIAALASLAMAVNYYLLDGLPAPWFQPSFAFGGAIDSGLLLALFSLVILLGRAMAGWRDVGRSKPKDLRTAPHENRRVTNRRERQVAA